MTLMSRITTLHFPLSSLFFPTACRGMRWARLVAFGLVGWLGGVKAAVGCEAGVPRGEVSEIRTTAYTHTEASHLKYGTRNAVGESLRYGMVRSAAADWSRFPLGTRFRIDGGPEVYVIDDYGSALVGKDTIDLYKPTAQAMRQWGVRHVEIEVIEWGSFEKSLAVLLPRARHASHVAAMVRGLRAKVKEQVARHSDVESGTSLSTSECRATFPVISLLSWLAATSGRPVL